MIHGSIGLGIRNFRFFWRGNLAVVLGSAVGAAVLVGALIVGDSLRGSLKQRVLDQLGPYENLLSSGRLFREELASKLPGDAIGLLLLQGSVRTETELVGKVNVYGIPAEFGPGFEAMHRDKALAILNPALAERLKIKPGERLRLRVQKASSTPRSSVLTARDVSEVTQSVNLEVESILDSKHWAAPFNLSPSPGTPLNLFVPLKYLQRQLEQAGRINAMLHHGANRDETQQTLKTELKLEDVGLQVNIRGKGKYLAVDSSNLLIEPILAEAIQDAAKSLSLRTAPTLVYLVNRIHAGADPAPPAAVSGSLIGGVARLTEIPYSVVAALDPSALAPLGPFLPSGSAPLRDDEILLTDWSKPTLIGATPNAPIHLHFFNPEVEGQVEYRSKVFKLRSLIPLEGAANDRDLTPTFPGITDKVTLADWEPPFPYENSWVGPRDDAFWNRYRATPKAFITLEAGQKLWRSRFGELTSIRLATENSIDLQQLQKQLGDAILKRIKPEELGLSFDAVRDRLLQSSQGSNDFGMLFLGFSFFLIVAALLLVGLLVSLNLERRQKQFGLLLASGYTLKRIQRIVLWEGMLLSILGTSLGLILAGFFASGLLKLLASVWPDRSIENLLQLHAEPLSLIIGFVASICMSLLAIAFAIRGLKKFTPVELLKGQSEPNIGLLPRFRWTKTTFFVGILGAIAMLILGPFLPAGEPQAGGFFGAGFFLLMAGIAGLRYWLLHRSQPVRGQGIPALRKLARRNLLRNPSRSLLTAGVLASASFLLVAVESFRREPEKDFLNRDGGSGGFAYLVETDLPMFIDPGTSDGLQELLQSTQTFYQGSNGDEANQNTATILKDAEASFREIEFYSIRKSQGDDASCLNLFQATRPQVLGIPDKLIDRGGFRLVSLESDDPEVEKNPWLLLRQPRSDGQIPAFIEQNSATYALKKGLGDTIELPDGQGGTATFRLVGMMKDSIFQSQLLVGEQGFRTAFPRQEGFNAFLVDTQKIVEPLKFLQAGFLNYGGDVQSTAERVSAFLAVQNSYLTTFQMLGGFGMILGTFGLAAVLLRNVWERRGELALLRSVGYAPNQLSRLIMIENAMLLGLGLLIGVLAALASVLPHIFGQVALPVTRLSAMLGLTLLMGVIVVWLSAKSAMRGSILTALRRE
jgi:putative ABC transport system permease protein